MLLKMAPAVVASVPGFRRTARIRVRYVVERKCLSFVAEIEQLRLRSKASLSCEFLTSEAWSQGGILSYGNQGNARPTIFERGDQPCCCADCIRYPCWLRLPLGRQWQL